jgi:3-deoxy-D-arabino-heptulosonate 7-phosphate (DAHP) synthase
LEGVVLARLLYYLIFNSTPWIKTPGGFLLGKDIIMNGRRQKIEIYGPCAAESREQVLEAAQAVADIGASYLRACLWKPRTRPGFDGVGEEGMLWLAEASLLGIGVATEVFSDDQVEKLAEVVFSKNPDARLLVWLGSRSQVHYLQREVGKAVSQDKRIKVLIKHQMWEDESHWLGIMEHVLDGGASAEQVIMCHRGFHPSGRDNPLNLRNLPHYDMAMRVREQTGVPMVIDPSHIGGTVDNVIKILLESKEYDFDGYMIEAHPTPELARTDAKQQLSLVHLQSMVGSL